MTKEDVSDAIKIALVVGAILSLINQYDVLLDWSPSVIDFIRIFLNFLVPFCVASLSRVMYIRKIERRGI